MSAFLKNADIRILGSISYDEAMHLQDEEFQKVRDGISRGAVFLLEHDPPVVTLGRRSDTRSLFITEDKLALQGYQLRKTTRGGLVTVHEPGQAIAYFVTPTSAKSSASFVMHVMRTAAKFLAKVYGISANYDNNRPGLWINGRKLCFCGFDFTGGVSRHGFAINVSNTMKGFSMIVPCGMPDTQIVSVSEILESPVDCRFFINKLASFFCAMQ